MAEAEAPQHSSVVASHWELPHVSDVSLPPELELALEAELELPPEAEVELSDPDPLLWVWLWPEVLSVEDDCSLLAALVDAALVLLVAGELPPVLLDPSCVLAPVDPPEVLPVDELPALWLELLDPASDAEVEELLEQPTSTMPVAKAREEVRSVHVRFIEETSGSSSRRGGGRPASVAPSLGDEAWRRHQERRVE
jgi:hypothetical protein